MILKIKTTVRICSILLLIGSAKAAEWTSSIGIVGGFSRLNELTYFTSEGSIGGLNLGWGGAFGIQYSLRKGYIGFSGLLRYQEFASEDVRIDNIDMASSLAVLGRGDAQFRILSLNVGVDLFFFDTGRIQPYFCGHVSLNSYGLSKIVVEPLDPSDVSASFESDKQISDSIRLGAGFGAGINVSVLDWLEIGPVVRYEVYNLENLKQQYENIYDSVLSTRKVSSITFLISVMAVL